MKKTDIQKFLNLSDEKNIILFNKCMIIYSAKQLGLTEEYAIGIGNLNSQLESINNEIAELIFKNIME